MRPEKPTQAKPLSCDVGEDHEFSIELPLDSDGFLRRECPTCEREFKWFPSTETDDISESESLDDAYFCPYCGIRSTEAWLTKDQAQLVESTIQAEVIAPELKELQRGVDEINRSSRGLIGIEVSLDVEGRDEATPEHWSLGPGSRYAGLLRSGLAVTAPSRRVRPTIACGWSSHGGSYRSRARRTSRPDHDF